MNSRQITKIVYPIFLWRSSSSCYSLKMINPASTINAKIPTSFTPGPIIGTYSGRPIYDFLIDNFGVKRVYDGVALDPKKIPPNSIYAKGLVYVPEA